MVLAAPRQNVTGWTRNLSDYYEEELVAERDRFIVERFGYSPPEL